MGNWAVTLIDDNEILLELGEMLTSISLSFVIVIVSFLTGIAALIISAMSRNRILIIISVILVILTMTTSSNSIALGSALGYEKHIEKSTGQVKQRHDSRDIRENQLKIYNVAGISLILAETLILVLGVYKLRAKKKKSKQLDMQ